MAILSTAYLPPIEYFSILKQHKAVQLEKHETYAKQSYRNRCMILTANGPQKLIVPVFKPKGNHTPTCEIEISYNENWQVNHWRAIEAAYNASPYFEYYRDEFKPFYQTKRFNYLFEYNWELIRLLLKITQLNCQLKATRMYLKQVEAHHDFRNRPHPKNPNDKLRFAKYNQVFSNKFDFVNNLSIIDLIFNTGPDCKQYLRPL